MIRAHVAAAAALLLTACATNPVTGKRQLSLVSESQEIELGKQSAEEVRQTMPRYPDEKVQAYVSGVGMRMAKASERPNLPWSFTVVDDAAVNAFALPGGPIFITRGILTHMNSEAELASVLGHEIGHVTARHSVQQLSKAQLAQVGLGIGSVISPELAGLSQAAGAGLQLLFLKYGRDAESQSDQLGFKYMLKEGWDPHEMPKMFATLQRVSASAGGDKLPGYLSTHPDPGDREAVAQKRAAEVKQPGLAIRRDEYLAIVNGMPYGEDPRQGFFQGNAFVHPDLRFRVEFPEGWKKQNGATAVVAMSPGQDAMIQLGAAGKEPPAEAAKKFLSQKGIQPATAPASLGALPPNSSYFQAQTEQGAVAGLVSFVSHGGATFGILGYTEASKLPAQDAAFRKTVASFAELKDPALLAVHAPKVELVKVPRAMTVAEFVQQFPSTASADEVATVNGLAKDGQLAAGQQAKRIVGGVLPK
jgi:predicted Zn-dependent protease